jgi:hypothetical protein
MISCEPFIPVSSSSTGQGPVSAATNTNQINIGFCAIVMVSIIGMIKLF